jgi:hypothetical protein
MDGNPVDEGKPLKLVEEGKKTEAKPVKAN